MNIKITKKDIIWGYVAQSFKVGAGAILLPFILKLLPTETLGVWYIFVAISGFALMLDMGFLPTFARNVAYTFSGATRLKKEGIDYDCELLTEPNYPLLKALIATMKQFYGGVSVVIVVLLLTAGTWYIHLKTNQLPDYENIIVAWHLYIVSIVLNFYYSYYNALLIGRGFVKENNQLTIITQSTYIVLGVIGLLCGYGILAVAAANLVSMAVNRICAVRFFHKKNLGSILKTTVKAPEKLLGIIWFNARKVGIASVGSFFIRKGNLLFVSMFLPLDVVGSYGLTTQIVGMLGEIAPLYLTTYLPEIYRHRITNNIKVIKRIFGEGLFVYAVLFVVGGSVIFFLGDPIIGLFNPNDLLLPATPLLLLLLFQFLEYNHALAHTLITTRNQILNLKASLISGAAMALLTCLSLAFTTWGVTGVIVCTGLVQAAYNNWRWPQIVCKELDSNYFSLTKVGFTSLWSRLTHHPDKSKS